MNDRFKFRFWYKPKNRYINTEKLVLNDGTYTQVGTKQMNNGTYCSYIVNEYNSSDVIPEQCTGLKDNNGKLIYEGDILKCVHSEIMKYKVYWARCGYRMKVYGTDNKLVDDSIIFLDTSTLEIIGNIHENADLLENE